MPNPIGVPQSQMVGDDKMPEPVWLQFFLTLWSRTGGSLGSATLLLDSIANAPGSILIRTLVQWVGLNPGSPNFVLQMGAILPQWGNVSSASFANQIKNLFLAGPLNGAAVAPTFRTIGYQDLQAGQAPGTATNDNAVVGNVGEIISSQVASGAAVALATGVAKDITSINLSAGDWDLWGNIATSAAPTSANGWINSVTAVDPGAPNQGAYIQWVTSQCLPVGMMRVSLAAPETLYLSINATFGGALSAYGFLGARRRR
jgi:hypothetical protein